MTPQIIKFTVYGKPQQKGSKKPFVNRRKDGSTFAGMKDTNDKAAPWQAAVRAAAAEAYQGKLLQGACRIDIVCFFQRRNGHFGTGRNAGKLKPSAPEFYSQQPDKDKLERTINDGLQGVIVRNDSQFCQGETRKEWTVEQECAVITIETLEDCDEIPG